MFYEPLIRCDKSIGGEEGIACARSAVLGDPRGGASDQMNARSLRSLPFLFSASGPGKPVPSATNKNAPIKSGTFISSAERKGFEPLIPFRVYTLSRRAPSTTRTPLLIISFDCATPHSTAHTASAACARHYTAHGRKAAPREGCKSTISPLTFRIFFVHFPW